MPKFFVDRENIQDGKVTVVGDDAFHIARALRMAVGDELTVSDKCGVVLYCRLERIRDDECILTVLSEQTCSAEPPAHITLFMAYPKGDKLETVVQKAVELGASVICPFESSRCIKRPAPDKAAKQTARLQRIAEEASKQCGRGRLPKIEEPLRLKDILPRLGGYDITLLCYENENGTTLKSVLKSADKRDSIAVIVGSEGGFSPEEAELIVSAGAVSVGLGPRILRCETAPDYALSAISYELEL